MNRAFSYLAAAALVLALSCCRKEPGSGQADSDVQTFTARFELGSPAMWLPEDRITVFQVSSASAEFVSDNSNPSATASFTGSVPYYSKNESHWAVYPSDAAKSCNDDEIFLTVGPDSSPHVAKGVGTSFLFRNVCGAVCFSVSQSGVRSVTFKGNAGEVLGGTVHVSMDRNGAPYVSQVLAGKREIALTAEGTDGFEVGKTYRMSILSNSFRDGYTLTLSRDGRYAEKKVTSQVSLDRNETLAFPSVDSGMDFQYDSAPVDLSAGGLANCYIVPGVGNYNFRALRPDGTTLSEGSGAAAVTLWESFGTEEVPSAGDIISEVEYSDGSIRFHASGRAGNALIALKDSSGKILWSWHIWSCPGFNPSECSHVFNTVGGTLMDRNLGATSVVKGEPAALGLMYQWGRKDPFPGPCKTFYPPTYSQKPAATTLEWPSPVASDASKGTIAYSVSHPTTFIRGNSLSMDWYYTTSLPTDNTRWKEPASAKGLYDPCPAGWRVPGGASSVNWSGTLGNYKPFVSGPWNPEGYGMDFGTGNGNSLQLGAYSVIWYPAAGFIDGSNGELRDAGTVGRYQTCTVSHCYAYQFAVNSTAYVFPQRIGYRSCACAVRCAAIE